MNEPFFHKIQYYIQQKFNGRSDDLIILPDFCDSIKEATLPFSSLFCNCLCFAKLLVMDIAVSKNVGVYSQGEIKKA